MFHDRKTYNKINKIHQRALRITHKDSTSNFENLPSKSNSVSVHQRNLQLLLLEIYKTVNILNPSFMAEVFITNVVPYNLRGSTNLVLPKARTNLYGIDTVRFVGQKLWQSELSLSSLNSLWSSAQSKLPTNIFNFSVKYINNTLPTQVNLHKWGLSSSSDCSFCLVHESLLHVVSGCKVYLQQGRYTWRHDSILLFIAKSFQSL